jgi:hypothetical protein
MTMKVLVATNQTQGKRPTDRAGCIEGELVWTLDPCPASRGNPYGPCDCGRTFRGVESDGVSTTARVDDMVGFTHEDCVQAVLDSWDHGPDCTCDHDVERIVTEMLAQADRLPVGAVVERHLRRINVRLVVPR